MKEMPRIKKLKYKNQRKRGRKSNRTNNKTRMDEY
jgi:hypothetical protein